MFSSPRSPRSPLGLPSTPVPVVVVASIDVVARQSFTSGLLLDLPRAVCVTHDLDPDPDGGGLRRVITDLDGVRSDERRSLDHACLSCAVREDLVPTLRRLMDDGRFDQVIVALPIAADPPSVISLLQHEIRAGRCGRAELACALTLLDPASLLDDLLGDDLLAERGLALGAVDRRSVGEVLARQIESADLVLTSTPAGGTPARLLQHLTDSLDEPVGWNYVDGNDLVRRRLDWSAFQRRTDPLQLPRRATRTDPDVWTLDLTSTRAFHPHRLHERIEDLGRGAFRARGHFWLPTRPEAVCVWDGAGGQLSLGRAGSWRSRRPSCRLIVTGVDLADRARVVEAFNDVLLTAAETSTARSWLGDSDGFEPWLDDQASAA